MTKEEFKDIISGQVDFKKTKSKNNIFFDLGCSLAAIGVGVVIILAGLAWIIAGVLVG